MTTTQAIIVLSGVIAPLGLAHILLLIAILRFAKAVFVGHVETLALNLESAEAIMPIKRNAEGGLSV